MSQSNPDIGLGTTILRRAALTPKREALIFEGTTYTFEAFADRIKRLSAALRAGGVCRGDRVGYIGLNHPSFLETLYAAASLGAIFVPLNFRLQGPEIRFIANDAGLHTLLVDDALREMIQSEQSNLCCRRYISVESAVEGWDHLDSLYQQQEPIQHSEQVGNDDPAVIMYTSGTTGLPKGAILTHGNLFWNTVNTLHNEDAIGMATLTCAPLFHIGGLNVTTLPSLSKGVRVVLHRSFDPSLVLKDIEQYQVSGMFGAPTMFLMMSQHPDFATADLSSIKALICGGAPVPLPLIELYGKQGVTFCQGYGLTETAPFASMLSSDLSVIKAGSAGTAPLFTHLKIVDTNKNTMPSGERGEVCIKGPNVMKGYWNRPDATAEAIDEQGWFYSGDVGYIDEEGFLYLCDRAKDMIISGGENIYPAEIESVLYQLESIKEVAVIGLPDDKWGESTTAVVVLEDNTELSIDELREYCKDKLASYKIPRQIRYLDILPRNPAGKVLKFKLRDDYSAAS